MKLAQASHKALLDQHYQIYPVSASLDYELSDTSGTLIFNWRTLGTGSGANLLMLTWPHHRLTMQNANFPDKSTLGYLTTKVRLAPYMIPKTWESTSDFAETGAYRVGCIPLLAINGECDMISPPSYGTRHDRWTAHAHPR